MAAPRTPRAPTTQAPTSPKFTCFSRLPLELRQMIWKWTLEPRVVDLKFDTKYSGSDDFSDSDSDDYDNIELHSSEGFYTTRRVPAALQVSQGSRNAVLHLYPRLFGSIWYPKRVRFNMSLDTLYIDACQTMAVPLLFSVISKFEQKTLRYLAFERHCFSISDPDTVLREPGVMKRLKRSVESLKGLHELLIVEDIKTWHTKLPSPNPVRGKWQIDGQQPSYIELYDAPPSIFAGLELDTKTPNSTKNWKVKSQYVVLGWKKNLEFIPEVIEGKLIESVQKEGGGC